MDNALNRLVDAVGIETHYWDIGGGGHETSPETARRLLGALGFPAATEAEIETSLVRLQEELWRETLPPVTVVAQEQEIAVPLRLSAAARGHLRWRLELEGGAQAGGEVAIEDLAIEARGSCDGVEVLLRRLRLPAQP